MRNPVLIFPVGLLIVIVIAAISAKLEVIPMSQLTDALKTLSVIFVPMILVGGAFAYSAYRGRNR